MASDYLNNLKRIIEEWLWSTGWTVPPLSGIFFIFVTILMSLMSNALNHLLIDMDEMSKQQEIMAKHNADKKKAMEEGDKKLWIKVRRNEPAIQELQQKSSMSRMIPMLATYGPIIFIFGVLRETFQNDPNLAMNGDPTCINSCGGVVVLPFGIPESFPVLGKWFSPYALDPSVSIAGYGFWYFLSAIVTSQVFLKIFGINLSRNPQSQSRPVL